MMEKTINIKFEITPIELAEQFCDMDAKEQAQFFNSIGMISTHQWEDPFVFQLQAIVDTEKLNNHGKDVMQQIGDYAK